ncbi:MAG: phosphoadenosine phosphosulfate reductase family protein, partial [Aquimonas sp.]
MSAQPIRIDSAPADLDALVAAAADDDGAALGRLNHWLEGLDADARIRFAMAHLPGSQALSSSFGAQAAVCLHLLNQHLPGLPVVVVDTGYLFTETYQF